MRNPFAKWTNPFHMTDTTLTWCKFRTGACNEPIGPLVVLKPRWYLSSVLGWLYVSVLAWICLRTLFFLMRWLGWGLGLWGYDY